MESLGAQLKAAREQKHVSVGRAAQDTRISATHLENLESGHFHLLPGGVYNRAFLKMYSVYLGLDPQVMLDRYKAETSTEAEKTVKAGGVRTRSSEPLYAAHPIVLWSVMLLASIAVLYFSRSWISDVFSPYFTHREAPPQLQPPSPPTTGTPESAQVSLQPAAGAQSENSQVAAPAAATEARLPPQAPGTIRLQLQITQRCWVSVTSDGNRVLVKLLEPGDSQTFDAAESLYLILGNAGGVRASINGQTARPFGKDGEVVKVSINGQNVHELLEKPDDPRNAPQ